MRIKNLTFADAGAGKHPPSWWLVRHPCK